jgi:hypothetical protein
MPTDDVRQLVPKVITRFRGISQFRSIAGQPMEWAQDLNNVIVSGAGFLEKLRSPLLKANQVNIGGTIQSFIDTMYDFQKADGTRQLIANFLQGLGYFTEPIIGGIYTFTLIEASGADYPRYSYVDSNNILYLTNGNRMLKWLGSGTLQNWGIVAPVNAPQIGISVPIASIKRVSNVITVTMDISGFPVNVVNGFHPYQLISLPAGTVININGVVADNSANGNFTITVQPADYQFQYASPGADFGPVTQGSVIVYYTPCGNNGGLTDFSITQVQQLGGIVTLFFKNNYRILASEEITVSGLTAPHDIYNGLWTVVSAGIDRITFTQPGADVQLAAASGAGIVAGGFSDQVGPRTWRYSYGNSVIGDEGAMSPISNFIPTPTGDGLVNNVRAYLTAQASPDPQVDTLFWYATLDSGSNWFRDNNPDGYPVSSGYSIGDGNDDDLIDVTIQGSLINIPPQVSTKLSKWQSRIYAVPVANPQSLIYSGYEKILVGRPECNFPPGNQILLNIGANVIKAHAPLMNGVVIWDNTNKMFMFKGTVEDIVTTQPVSYSEQVEEMPWQIGNYSHEATKSTPYGVIWFGADKAFHKWNGIFYGEIIGPVDISQNIYPLLQRITPGTEGKVQAEYFNFLERDWYVALICIDGSITPNRILFFDVSKEDADNLGTFISDIQADAICVRTDSQGQRHLLITVQGRVYEIKATTTATAGIHAQMTSTSAQLDAWWLSGYDGSEEPLMMKMYRFGRLVADQTGFNLIATLVDDETSTLVQPVNQRNLYLSPDGKFAINWKARRCSLLVQFPTADIDASVIQLSLVKKELSNR